MRRSAGLAGLVWPRIGDEAEAGLDFGPHDRPQRQGLLGKAHEIAIEERVADMEVVRGSFLVERRKIAAFDRRMDDMARESAARMHFKYVCPLPPHSFVSLSVGRV